MSAGPGTDPEQTPGEAQDGAPSETADAAPARWHAARLAAAAEQFARLGHDLRGILSPALLAAERLQLHQDESVRRAGDVVVRAVERAVGALAEVLAGLRESVAAPRLPVKAAAPPGLALDSRIDAELTVVVEAARLAETIHCLLADAVQNGATSAIVSAAASPRLLVLEFICARVPPEGLRPQTYDAAVADLLAQAAGGTLVRGLTETELTATLTVRRF
jgi:hypothetical protein